MMSIRYGVYYGQYIQSGTYHGKYIQSRPGVPKPPQKRTPGSFESTVYDVTKKKVLCTFLYIIFYFLLFQ